MKQNLWYNELGFNENPFSIKSLKSELEANELLIRDVVNKINLGEIVLVYGDYGTGKSSLLKTIMKEINGKIAYYNCGHKTGSINFEKIIISAGGFFSRLFRIKTKNIVLLLDESLDMNRKDIAKTIQHYNEGYFKSVVFVSKMEDISFIRNLDSLVGRNKYMMKGLDRDDAVKLARKRLNDLNHISDELIARIFMKNRNPRAFLRNCENVFKHAYEKGAQKITDEHIKEVLG